jgi:hypothetical protein
MHLVLLKTDGPVFKTYSIKKRRILNFARGTVWQKADLSVVYYVDGQCINDNRGTYQSLDDLVKALFAFTEPDLLITESLSKPAAAVVEGLLL